MADALARTLKVCDLSSNAIVGSLKTDDLPALEELSLSNCAMTGTVRFPELPGSLKSLLLSSNEFSGTVDLTDLADMKMLDLSFNRFSGSVDLRELPETLETLNLRGNYFVGEIVLTSLPAQLRHFALNGNQFSGVVNFFKLPDALAFLDLSMNGGLRGQTDPRALPTSLIRLNTDGTEIMRTDCIGSAKMGPHEIIDEMMRLNPGCTREIAESFLPPEVRALVEKAQE